MWHTNFYTFQQQLPRQTSMRSKSWVFWHIPEIFSTSPESWCVCQIPEFKRYAECHINFIAMIRQSIWFIKYFRKKCAADTHRTWFHPFFHSSASKKQKGYFFLFISLPFKRFFCPLQNFLVVSHFSLTGTKITCYI